MPVRTGNAAYKQFQLDIFGEVSNTLFQCRQVGLDPSPDSGEDVVLALLLNSWRRGGNDRTKESGKCGDLAVISLIPK